MDHRQLCVCAGIPVRVHCQRKVLADRYIRGAAGEVPLDQPCGKDNGVGGAVGGTDRVGAAANGEDQGRGVLCRAGTDAGVYGLPGVDAGVGQASALLVWRSDLLDDMEAAPGIQPFLYRSGPGRSSLFIT